MNLKDSPKHIEADSDFLDTSLLRIIIDLLEKIGLVHKKLVAGKGFEPMTSGL